MEKSREKKKNAGKPNEAIKGDTRALLIQFSVSASLGPERNEVVQLWAAVILSRVAVWAVLNFLDVPRGLLSIEPSSLAGDIKLRTSFVSPLMLELLDSIFNIRTYRQDNGSESWNRSAYRKPASHPSRPHIQRMRCPWYCSRYLDVFA